jgi:hypothetical protein
MVQVSADPEVLLDTLEQRARRASAPDDLRRI